VEDELNEGMKNEGQRKKKKKKKKKEEDEKESAAPEKFRRGAIVSPRQTCFGTNELHYRKSGI